MDKLILVIYLNVENLNNEEIAEETKKIEAEFQRQMSGDVHCFVVPIKDSDTRIECINPKLVSAEDYKEAKKALEKIKEALNINL